MSNPLLPSSLESERGLVAAFFLNQRAVGASCAQSGIDGPHFMFHPLAVIYEQMRAMWEDGHNIDFLSLTRALKDSERWKHLPGENEIEKRGFLGKLEDEFHCPVPAEAHIEALIAKKRLRDTILLCRATEAASYEAGADPDAITERLISGATGLCGDDEEILSGKEMAQRMHSDLSAAHEGQQFISTGLRGIDLTAGPFQRGNVIVVCGQTGGGKSALVSSMIVHKLADYHMLVFSLEMRPELYGDRIIAAQNGVNMHNLRKKFFTGAHASEGEYAAISRTIKTLAESRLHFTNRINSLPKIIAATRRIAAKQPLDLVALDYAQLVEVAREKGDSREREVAKVSRSFKALANDLGFLGIILSQLNDEGRMRESRSLAHDADAVLSIEKDEEHGVGVRALKARSAPPGTFIPLRWQPEFTKFSDAQ